MDKPDSNDQQIRELFSTARKVDRKTLPGFQRVLDAERRAERRAPAGRAVILGFAAVTASIALALAFLTLSPDLDPVSQTATTSTPAVAPELTQQPAPVDVAQRIDPETSAEVDPGIQRALQSLGTVTAAEGEPKSGKKDNAAAVQPPPAPAGVSVPKPKPKPQPQRPPKPLASPPPPPAATVVAQAEADESQRDAALRAIREYEAAKTSDRATVVAAPGALELEKTSSSTKSGEEFVQELAVPGRFYQNVLTTAPGASDPEGEGEPTVHGSRSRDFTAVVGGVSNIDPLTGQFMGLVESDSIEDVEVIAGGAGVKLGRAQGGYVAANVPPGRQAWRSYAQAAGQVLEFELEEEANTESYDMIEEKGFVTTTDESLSTFSIDVDTASYSNIRRYLSRNQLPPRDAVRIEEMINYFDYDYPEPSRGEPFSTSVDVAGCPWNEEHRLARIGIRGRDGGRAESEGSNLVFLIDVSGSMRTPNKLPLLKSAFAMLVEQLGARDQVAIVVYAGNSGLVLPSTSGADGAKILNAINRLEAGGSTNGGAGIELAYKVARENFIRGGVNRVVLATDGDFNVGHTNGGDLLLKVKSEGNDGIALTALGFGMGNLKDATLELLADKGDGNYFYIDSKREARKVLVEELQGTLVTIAKDVKIQVEFNPTEVAAYRLIGYENRTLAKQDFNDDKKDAGEIGSGHTVTALYEIVPAGIEESGSSVDPLKYQRSKGLSRAAESGELFTLKVRYKEPEESKSRLLQFAARDDGLSFDDASADFRFAAAVASFGMVLRDSEHRGTANLDGVAEMLERGVGADKGGYRAEFHTMVQKARAVPGR